MKSFYYYVFFIALLILAVPSVSRAAQNTTGYAWGENVGWINVATSSPASWGVNVTDTELTGYMYGENIGWISLNCSNGTNTCANNPYKVINNGQGKLSGYAWGENVGWIDFGTSTANRTWGVTIGTTTNVGEFLGYAYGENIGWISFNCRNGTNTCATNSYKATTSWRVTGGSTYSISGTVKYYDTSKKVRDATVTLRNASGVTVSTYMTDANGGYLFTNVPGGNNYTVGVTKIDNTVSGLNIFDVTTTIDHIQHGTLNGTIHRIIAADLDNNGSVNVFDLTRMINSIKSNIISTTLNGGWRFYPSGTTLTTGNYLTTATSSTISSLSANITNQDFISIRIGDANNSWIGN